MKNIFRNLAVVSSLIAALAFVSCQEKVETGETAFSMVDTEISEVLPAWESTGSATFTLDWPVAGEKIAITSDASWLTDLNDRTAYEISVTALLNETGAPRTANVHVAYMEFTGDFTVSQEGASTDLSYGDFFRSDSLYILGYTQFANDSTKAVLPVDKVIFGNASSYRYALYEGSLGVSELSDEDAIAKLNADEAAVVDKPSTLFVLDFEKAYTLIGFAVDQENNNSKVYRESVNFKMENSAEHADFEGYESIDNISQAHN